jgi:hypothetical protein
MRAALFAVLASLALPTAAHASLVQGVPTNVQGAFWEDASIGGDNHMGWGYSGSEVQPMAITFGTTLTNAASDPFSVCGYASTTTGWLRAYQISGSHCPAGAPAAGQNGWFEYVIANHSSSTAPGFLPFFNRYHLMDLQRFALVPLPTSAGGPAGAATAWDTDWGTCLAYDEDGMGCEQHENAALPLSTLIAGGVTKTTQEQDPAPDAERIVLPAAAMSRFPDGRYQIVAIANPYDEFAGGSSVACTTISLSGVGDYAPVATQVGGAPATCYVPTNRPAAVTGPGGRDPMAGAAPTTPACELHVDDPTDPDDVPGHCWAHMPKSNAPGDPLAPHPLVRSNANALLDQYVTPTSTVAVAQGGAPAILPAPSVGTTAPTTIAEGRPPVVIAASGTPTLTRRLALADTATALRKEFGTGLSRTRTTCKLHGTSAATCTVSWHKHAASYSGRLWVRYLTAAPRPRWEYRLDVTRRAPHHRAQAVRRVYRTGGLL